MGDSIERSIDGGEVGKVACTVRQANIEIRSNLAEWKILLAMNACDEGAWLARQDCGVAIPLVNIEIENGDATAAPLRQQHVHRNRQIVERTESGSERTVCVMRPAGELTGNARIQSQSRCRQRTADRGPRALDQGLGPRQADPALYLRRESAVKDGVDIGRIVCGKQFAAAHPRRGDQFRSAEQPLALRSLSQRPIFAGRKAMAIR
jgi:hypothetical protein